MNAPAASKSVEYARCPVCRASRPLTKSGVFRKHKRQVSSWDRADCSGSGQSPSFAQAGPGA